MRDERFYRNPITCMRHLAFDHTIPAVGELVLLERPLGGYLVYERCASWDSSIRLSCYRPPNSNKLPSRYQTDIQNGVWVMLDVSGRVFPIRMFDPLEFQILILADEIGNLEDVERYL